MRQFVYPWFLCSCLVGLLLPFVHSTLGQGIRYLIDPETLTLKPVQPDSPSDSAPPEAPSPPGRTRTPTSPEGPSTAQPGALNTQPGTRGSRILPPNAPTGLGGSELGRVTIGNLSPFPPPALSSSSPSADISRTPLPKPPNRIVSVLEEETDDERAERELRIQRQRAEQINDIERRQAEIERVDREEALFRQRLARRQIDEAGTEDTLFYFPRLKEQYLRDGWCQLFDGHTDFGWKIQTEGHYAGPWEGGNFTFGDGAIESDSRFPGLVYTQIPFGDVTLRFDYWAEKDSRVFLLLKTPPDPADLNRSCYTFVLNSDQWDRPRGLLLGRHAHSLAELQNMRITWDDPMNESEGTWHSVIVKTEESNLLFWLDKRSPITYFVEEPLPPGHIAFLVTKGKARFQNILWQPSQSIAVFNTYNREVPDWRLSEDGELVGNNDVGFRLFVGSVESKAVYENYMLQMQYYHGSRSGKSSLFVRALPEQENTGYEISLQNTPQRRDRETLRGVDAGGFPQIKDARYIRPQDQQWTYFTMVAMNRQIQTWVNGVPVCEIYDKRRVREDSLMGPFLNPGTIRVSVPKENDQFQFRRLMISPM